MKSMSLNISTWGDVSLNTNYYLLQANKIFNGYIYSVGFIGTGNATGGINYIGLIYQCAIWNKQLGQPEVTALYNSGAGLPYTSW